MIFVPQSRTVYSTLLVLVSSQCMRSRTWRCTASRTAIVRPNAIEFHVLSIACSMFLLLFYGCCFLIYFSRFFLSLSLSLSLTAARDTFELFAQRGFDAVVRPPHL